MAGQGIVFHVQGPTGAPVNKALLSATSPNGDWQGQTNACGDFYAILEAGHYDLTVSAAGFKDRTLPADLADPGTITIGLDSDFRPAPRFWRGNMCGVRVPGLPPVPGGAADSSLVLSWFYDRYAPEDRARIRQAWHERNLTHVLLSWPDARVTGCSPEHFGAIVQELIADGFYPCPWLTSKPIDGGDDVPALVAKVQDILPYLAHVCPMVCLGGELNLWLSPQQLQALIDAVAPAFVAYGARVYVHFSQGYAAWQPDGQTFGYFWNQNIGKLTGVLHQKVLSQTPDEYRGASGGLTDILVRFAGGAGCSADSGFGHPFDLVAMEITAQLQFDGDCTEAQGNALGQWAIATPAVTDPHTGVTASVMGSGNGL